MCLDHSRVVLKPWPEGQGDFIHANWVYSDLLDNRFILTQGPLNITCGDFWRMVWQENVELILMLCRTCEENRNKCAQYWPVNPGQVLTFCGITIRAVEKRAEDPDVHCTALLMTYNGERRSLAHYQWVSWPDKFVPNQLTVPFTLLSSARARKTPTIIHCSAGIGRTGTLVVLEIVAKTLLGCRIPIVPEIIWGVRSQRSHVVQNEEQYLYIHYLTLQRLVNKGIVPDKNVSKFCRDYEHFYFARMHKVQIPLPVYEKKKESLRPRKALVSAQQKTTVPKTVAPLVSGTAIGPAPKRADVTAIGTAPLSAQSRKPHAPNGQKTAAPAQKGKAEKAAVESGEDYLPAARGEQLVIAKVTKSQADLQQQYREAQYALLESYHKAQTALLKTYEHKHRAMVPAEANVINDAQMEGKTAIAQVQEQPAATATAAADRTQAAKAEAENPQSLYAFPTEEVRKISMMQEIPKEDEVDRAGYVFMQPIYAGTYAAQKTDKNPDVVEKYVMNMLPEKYFNNAVDEYGGEYVPGVPPVRVESNKELVEHSYVNLGPKKKK